MGTANAPPSTDGETPRPAPATPMSAATPLPRRGQPDGLQRMSGRIPPQAGGHPINHHVAGARSPAHLGKSGCLFAHTLTATTATATKPPFPASKKGTPGPLPTQPPQPPRI